MLRENLHYKVLPKQGKDFLKQTVEHFLAKHPDGFGIIYCLTIDECNKLAKLLGDMARPYYSEMSTWQKKLYQNSWTQGQIRILCATSGICLI